MAKKKKQNSVEGKLFSEIKGDLRLLRRIWFQRSKGISFTRLEKEFALKESSGMTAFRAVEYYDSLQRQAKTKVKKALEPIAGPGEVVVDDSEPPTTAPGLLRSELSISFVPPDGKIQNYRSCWPQPREQLPEMLEDQMRSVLDDCLGTIFRISLDLKLIEFARAELLPILGTQLKSNAEKMLMEVTE